MSDGRPDPDIEAEFARIISGWDDEADLSHRERSGDPGLPTRTSESDPGLPTRTSESDPGLATRSSEPAQGHPSGAGPDAPADLSGLSRIPVWRGSSTEWDLERADRLTEDEHFEPQLPEPLPPYHDWRFWGVLVGLVGGPLLLLVIVALRPGWGSWVTTLALAMTVGGFLLLVLRGSGPRRDDPDGGARV